MPRIYMSMKKGDPVPSRWALENTPAIRMAVSGAPSCETMTNSH
jgi:hypothetical protein